MKLSVTIAGSTHEIDLEALGAQITAVEPGVYSVLLEGRSYEARTEPGEDGVVVFIDGHRFEAEIRDPRRWSRRGARQGAEGSVKVTAPMPGKVVRLLVASGDEVTAGQGLLVVEAMKMQNELKSPKAGRVASLHAQQGETVSAGEVLAVIE